MSKKKRKEKRMKKAGAWKGFFFILPSLCGLILFYLLPYLDVIKRSFSSPVTGAFTGLDNYWLFFGNKAFQLAVKNTVRFIITCVPILVISSLLVAVILQKIVKGNLLKIGFLFPMAIPVASVVLLWKGVFDPQGFLNSFLNLFGISGNDWMNTKSAFWVLEKHGVLHDIMVSESGSYSKRNVRSCKNRWFGRDGVFSIYYPSESSIVFFYDHGNFAY